MKKLSFAILIAFCFSTITFAQKKGDVEFGINLGYNSSTVQSSIIVADMRNGINLGIAADYYFSDRWSIKGKLIYDQKGWDNGFFYDQINDIEYKTDYNLNYLTIPVMANWHFGKKRNWYLNFGPYVGILMSAEAESLGVDVKDGFKSTDFGLNVGVGVKIPVSDKLKISLEYESQSGVAEVFNDNTTGNNITNSRGSFNVGLNFMLK